jgi:hypothetical protein
VAYIRADASPSEVLVTYVLSHRRSGVTARQCNPRRIIGKLLEIVTDTAGHAVPKP